MKIMQVISGLGNGGAEKLVVELCNEFCKQHDTILVSLKNIQDWMIFPRRLSPKIKFVCLGKMPGYDLRMVLKIAYLILKEKPDVINVHLGGAFLYVKSIVKLFSNKSFIYTIHNEFSVHADKFAKMARKRYKNLSFVCISQSIYTKFIKLYPNLSYAMIENGTKPYRKEIQNSIVKKEINQYKFDSFTKVLVSVGRLAPQKNYPLLLKTMQRLEGKNIILLIIGNDSTKNKKVLIQLHELKPKNVFFLGSKKNVEEFMAESDAFIMSSIHEGMPITVIEAMSNGLPIICTPAGGLIDMVKPSINGFMANDFTIESLLVAIKQFLNADKDTIQNICVTNIEEFKRKYSIEKTAKKYLDLYQKLHA